MQSKTEIVALGGDIQLWFNSTIKQIKLSILSKDHKSLTFLSLSLEKYDTKLIELKEGKIWMDKIVAG